MEKETIENIYKAYYPNDSDCVFTSHTASEICKDILDQQTKHLAEQLTKLQGKTKFDEVEVLKQQLADTKENEKHYVDKCFSLEEQLAEKSEALEYAENGHLAIQKDCDELFLKLAEKEKELSEVKNKLEIAIKSCWNDKD